MSRNARPAGVTASSRCRSALAAKVANRRAAVLSVLCVLSLGLVAVPSAVAAPPGAYFPSTPPPVQITRNLTLQEAARAGVVQLTPKGGFLGDDVALELKGMQVKAPITVALHVELTVEPRQSPAEREAIRDLIPYLEQKTEAELNKPKYKTSKGEPINFSLDYKYREPNQPADPTYDQVKIVDPTKDLPEPNPEFRSYVEGLGVPNGTEAVSAVFSTSDLKPSILAHESLHLMGLDDRYTDVYVTKGGREVPLPEKGLGPAELASYLKGLKPPVPPPPAGDVYAKDTPGTGRCDIMGSGDNLPCRKISKRDLKWIESQAGVQVEVQPGELLLNKTSADQNLAVGYPTTVLAPRGGTTVAPGVAAYCVDHSKEIPEGGGFDVGPALSTVPGFEGVDKLLQLNAQIVPSLTEPLLGIQEALWNLTDAVPLEDAGFSGEEEAVARAREYQARAGVAENKTSAGLPHPGDPNAAAAATAAVNASGSVLPSIAAQAVSPPPALRARVAQLVPSKVPSGQKVRSTLVLDAGGEATSATLRLQRRSGHHWRSVKSLPSHKIGSGNTLIPLRLGGLKPGKYRVRVSVSGPAGKPAVQEAPLTVTP
jgi:hypothetical protein